MCFQKNREITRRQIDGSTHKKNAKRERKSHKSCLKDKGDATEAGGGNLHRGRGATAWGREEWRRRRDRGRRGQPPQGTRSHCLGPRRLRRQRTSSLPSHYQRAEPEWMLPSDFFRHFSFPRGFYRLIKEALRLMIRTCRPLISSSANASHFHPTPCGIKDNTNSMELRL